jgi:hypothetical protein
VGHRLRVDLVDIKARLKSKNHNGRKRPTFHQNHGLSSKTFLWCLGLKKITKKNIWNKKLYTSDLWHSEN